VSRVTRIFRMPALVLTVILGVAPPTVWAQSATPVATPTGTTAATGLVNPRGITWGADGTMFVGLAGSGGDTPGPEGSPFSGDRPRVLPPSVTAK
jgi:hypothetical protein